MFSRVARAKLTQWHWSGAVFCPAGWCSRLRLLALMESANKVPFSVSGYDALDIGRIIPVPGLTGLPVLPLDGYQRRPMAGWRSAARPHPQPHSYLLNSR